MDGDEVCWGEGGKGSDVLEVMGALIDLSYLVG